jgi:hypothetical protein
VSDRRIKKDEKLRIAKSPVVTLKGWIAALRANGDRQCRGSFFSDDEFCALGLFLILTSDNRYQWHIPDMSKFRDLTGLNDLELRTVLAMNSQEFRSFDEIADYLELRVN